MITDPINDPENEDYSEVESCRHCCRLIEPGTETPFNGWFYHSHCAPAPVQYALEQEQRAAEAAGK